MDLVKLFNAFPGAVSQGLVWGIMAIGVYLTYRILDVSDLTVDGSMATGGAVAANPIPLLIPCHRVIGSDGSLTGYSQGLDKKAWLLEFEGARF